MKRLFTLSKPIFRILKAGLFNLILGFVGVGTTLFLWENIESIILLPIMSIPFLMMVGMVIKDGFKYDELYKQKDIEKTFKEWIK